MAAATNALSLKLFAKQRTNEKFQPLVLYFAIMAHNFPNGLPSTAAMMQFSEEIIKQLTPEEIDEFREAFMMFDKVSESLIVTGTFERL